MSEEHHQQSRRFSFSKWRIVFKTIVALGQVAYFLAKLFSLRE